ncbi:MAG TPA: hypothetical protein VHU15_17555 [Stellaceae bacterium]|jgi:hypothetical protein|nr:hypothetical protein [Stellaceae bacterium]
MARSRRRLRSFILGVIASAGLVVFGCFVLNCLIDPLWYLRGNVVSGINYPFNERLSKMVRLLPRLQDYDCVIFGTSRATLLPEDQAKGYRCYNLAISDGQVSEHLLLADYLRQRGFAPKLIIVEIKRTDLIGPPLPPDMPDFIRTGDAVPSILASYLTLDAMDFSIRTLRGDAPHHRYYDPEFRARLEVRSKKRYYNPAPTVAPTPPPNDVHAERGALYRQLRAKFPAARAIGFIPLESAWRMAAFSLTGGFDAYLAAVADIAQSYDEFLDFSPPSQTTLSKSPKETYDGLHYSREANVQVMADLLANRSDTAIDWKREDRQAVAALFQRRFTEFFATTAKPDLTAQSTEKQKPHPPRDESD